MITFSFLQVETTSARFTDSSNVGQNSFSAHTMEPLDGLTVANTTPEAVDLSWSPSSKADGYLVSRSENPDGPYVQIATINGRNNTNYTDGEAASGTSYYRVRAFLATNWTSPASVVSSTPIQAEPAEKIK